jgi:hypothetical protein
MLRLLCYAHSLCKGFGKVRKTVQFIPKVLVTQETNLLSINLFCRTLTLFIITAHAYQPVYKISSLLYFRYT